MRKYVLIISGAVILCTIITALILFLKVKDSQSQLNQAKRMIQKFQEEIKRTEAEKDKADKENERLQSDTLAYVSFNSQLQEDKERLQKRLAEIQKTIDTKEEDLNREKLKLETLEEKLSQEQKSKADIFFKEKGQLQTKIIVLESTLQQERGLYHYNLGVAYIQAKLYDEAVDAYDASLKFYPDNPEAYYNLGVLFEKHKNDPSRAIGYYRNYLKLKPDADDKEQIEALINKLK